MLGNLSLTFLSVSLTYCLSERLRLVRMSMRSLEALCFSFMRMILETRGIFCSCIIDSCLCGLLECYSSMLMSLISKRSRCLDYRLRKIIFLWMKSSYSSVAYNCSSPLSRESS